MSAPTVGMPVTVVDARGVKGPGVVTCIHSDGGFMKAALDEARAALRQPREHSGGHDDFDLCGICNVVFRGDDLCLTDIDLGTVHAACCGPERESYVNLDTGEPIGPDEPIPTPWRYDSLPTAPSESKTPETEKGDAS